MDYSLDQITTREDCQELIDTSFTDRKDLDLRKLQQEKQYRDVTNGSTGIDASLMAVTAELSAIETVVATLPEGETKEAMKTKIMSLTLKKRQLEERREKYGIIALLQKEYAITCIDKEIAENVVYAEALTRRLEQL